MPLKDLQNYIAERTEITDVDMNTLGVLVRVVRNFLAAEGYSDSTGLALRRPATKVETVTARLTNFDDPLYDWVEVDPAVDGTYSDRDGGRTSDDYGRASDPSGVNGFTADPTTGNVVVLRRGYDPDDDSEVWTIAGGTGGSAGSTVSVVKLYDTHTGGGHYKAHPVDVGLATVTPGSNLVASGVGTVDTSIELCVRNLEEVGTGSHWIDTTLDQVFFLARRTGVTATSGTNTVDVFDIQGIQPPSC